MYKHFHTQQNIFSTMFLPSTNIFIYSRIFLPFTKIFIHSRIFLAQCLPWCATTWRPLGTPRRCRWRENRQTGAPLCCRGPTPPLSLPSQKWAHPSWRLGCQSPLSQPTATEAKNLWRLGCRKIYVETRMSKNLWRLGCRSPLSQPTATKQTLGLP